MTRIKGNSNVTRLHPGRIAHDQVMRRVPARPKSVPPALAAEYRALMRELVAMPDWNHTRMPLVEAYLNALEVLRGSDAGQKLPASNSLLRLSRALGIVATTPAPLRPSPMIARAPAAESANAEGAPWSRPRGAVIVRRQQRGGLPRDS